MTNRATLEVLRDELVDKKVLDAKAVQQLATTKVKPQTGRA